MQLDVGAAFQRFKGKQLSAEGVDFSDSVGARRRRGYRGGEYVLELVGRRGEEEESVEARFNRLRQEIVELGEQVGKLKAGSEKESAEGKGVSATDVAGLQEGLRKLQVESVVGVASSVAGAEPGLGEKLLHSVETLRAKGGVGSGKETKTESGWGGRYELALGPSEGAGARAAALEGRLARLEAVVGSVGERELKVLGAWGGGEDSLWGAMEQLETRLSLLDPGAVEASDARLSALLTKLGAVKERESELSSGEAGMVAELSEKLGKWEELGAALPDIVARLQALQELHGQALQFAQSLTQLDGQQQQLGKTLATDRKLLDDAKANMATNLEEIKTIVGSLDKRITALGK